MLQILDTINKSIILKPVTGVQWTSAWGDSFGSSFVEGSWQGTSSSSSDSNVVPAPGANTRRVIKSVTLYNSSSEVKEVVLVFKDGGNEVIISKASLAPNETWYSSKTSTSLLATGNKGDITVNGNGSWTINTNAVTSTKILDGAVTSSKIALDSVTYAQLQPVSFSNRLLGRGSTAGTLDVEEISIGTGLSMSGTTLNNTGVTSVGLSAPSFLTVSGSPVTTSGTLTLALATQTANTVFAGPTTGIAAAPTFRALVAGDIPDLSSIYQPLDADLTAIAALTANGLLRKTAGVWAMDSASYLTTNQTITLSGDVTGSGTTAITATIANNAVTTAKILDASVTLAKMANMATDSLIGRDTTGTGSPEVITLSQALDFVGSPAQGDILYRGASTWTRLAAGTSGRVLQTKGTGANPEWAPAREVLTAARTYYVGFSLGSVTANATTDKIEKTAHGLENGDPVVFNAATAPTGITLGTVYYVRNKTANDFEIYTAATGGTQVNWTTSGSTVTCHTGNDNNSGIGTNGRSVALLTIQKAIDLASLNDSSIYNVTIQLADGLHAHTGTISGKNMGGAGRIIIQGNTTTPANTIVRLLSGGVVTQFDFTGLSTIYDLRAFEMQTNQLIDIGVSCQGAVITIAGGFRFSAGTQKYSLSVTSQFGGLVDIVGNITVANTGSNAQFFTGETGTIRFFNPAAQLVVTIDNNPVSPAVFGFLFSRNGGVILISGTLFNGDFFGGAAPVAQATVNGVIFGTLLRGAGQAAFVTSTTFGGQIQ